MAIKFSKEFEQAKLILNQEPLPDDIVVQLDEIRKNIPKNELEFFDQLYDHLHHFEEWYI